jgi:hypothetical protein
VTGQRARPGEAVARAGGARDAAEVQDGGGTQWAPCAIRKPRGTRQYQGSEAFVDGSQGSRNERTSASYVFYGKGGGGQTISDSNGQTYSRCPSRAMCRNANGTRCNVCPATWIIRRPTARVIP